MTDAEFEELTREIHETMFRLESMQREYRRQTGRRYVPSGPIRPKRTTTTTKEDRAFSMLPVKARHLRIYKPTR